MARILVDCKGETCPVPLVEMRKAVRKADDGDRLYDGGNHNGLEVVLVNQLRDGGYTQLHFIERVNERFLFIAHGC